MSTTTSKLNNKDSPYAYDNALKRKYFKSLTKACNSCTKCELSEGRTNVVKPRTLITGQVNLNANIVIVEEAPGFNEDKEGLSLVGKAGRILEDSFYELGLEREVFYTNMVRCRPGSYTPPLKQDKDACWPYLRAEIRIVRPTMIIGLGKHVCNELLGTEFLSMKELVSDGSYRYIDSDRDIDIPLIPMYHPSYLLHLREKGGEEYTNFRDQYWERFNEIKRTYKTLSS